jgi:hypothetical protein
MYIVIKYYYSGTHVHAQGATHQIILGPSRYIHVQCHVCSHLVHVCAINY